MTPDTQFSFSLIIAVISTIGVVYTLMRNMKNSTISDAEGIIRANTKLDTIATSLEDIKFDLRSINNRLDKISETQVNHEYRIKMLENKIGIENERTNNGKILQ